jgi:hypothetical protein
MESKDIEISKEVGKYLYNIAPEDAKIILMIAVLSPEGDVGRLSFIQITESPKAISPSVIWRLRNFLIWLVNISNSCSAIISLH